MGGAGENRPVSAFAAKHQLCGMSRSGAFSTLIKIVPHNQCHNLIDRPYDTILIRSAIRENVPGVKARHPSPFSQIHNPGKPDKYSLYETCVTL